jgi:hypothetical protein
MSSSRIIESFKLVFIIELLKKSQKVLNPYEISINTTKQKQKNFPPKFDKILGCYTCLLVSTAM